MAIVQRPTGVPGLDTVLGGGIPECSFNVIAGGPGTGKSTLASQIAFNAASAARPALYFSLLGEQPLNLLRYHQQFRFFATEKVNRSVHFFSLADAQPDENPASVVETIVQEVKARNPGVIVIDAAQSGARIPTRQLAMFLASWQATSFLVVDEADLVANVADAILVLAQPVVGRSSARTLQVLKLRGQPNATGVHAMRITDDGIEVFPRTRRPLATSRPLLVPTARLQFGVLELDEMTDGGIPPGQSVLVFGPHGSGRSLLGTHFAVEGARASEAGVIALFDEAPETFGARASGVGLDLRQALASDRLILLDRRSIDSAVEEESNEIRRAADRVGARRVVVDSLAGLRLAVDGATRGASVSEIVFRLMAPLSSSGLSVLMTANDDEVGFLTDNLIELRQDGARRMLRVLKMRTSAHAVDPHMYEIGCGGISVQLPPG